MPHGAPEFAAMTIEQALFRLHEGLPRHAPGSESTTLKVLRRFGRLSRRLRVIDLGCGSGASTRVLARRFKKAVVAVDAHKPYLDELVASLGEENLTERVETVHSDFSTLGDALGRFDLLWAEGAAYVLGFEHALLSWNQMLAPRGKAAISELSYLVEQPSDEVKEYWSNIYPRISTVVGNCAAAERAGYNVVETVTLSNKDRKAYYGPIKAKMAALRADSDMSAEISVVISEMEQEIEFAARHSEEVGYVFYLLEKQGGETNADSDVADALMDDDGDIDTDVDDEVEEEGIAFEPVIPRGRKSRSGSSTVGPRVFDVSVAPTNVVTYHKVEQQLVDLIGELGIEQAARVFGQVQSRIRSVVLTGQ